VVEQDESYASKANALALDPLPTMRKWLNTLFLGGVKSADSINY
jgi:hypothetical protein